MESNDQDSHAVMKSPKENLMTVRHIEKNKFMLADILGRISSTVREKLLANINIVIMLNVFLMAILTRLVSANRFGQL